MKFKELKVKTADELKRIYLELRVKMQDLNFKVASQQLKRVREIREVKKNIAQINTILNQEKK
jgi:large subunit ribosomal protein L29